MEINIEKTGTCISKVSVVIPPEKIDEELNKTFKQTADSVSFPGFRKGKVPKKLVNKRFGDIIKDEVRVNLVREAIAEAIKDHNLEPVEEPDLDISSIEMEQGNSMEFAFEVATRPEFELGEYKGLEVNADVAEVSDSDIDEGIMAIRSRFAYLKTVYDKPVDKKHYVTVDLVYKGEGKDDLAREEIQANMSLGIIDGIEAGKEIEKLLGKKTGDLVEVEIQAIPPHFVPEEFRGKAAKIQVKIKEIREVAFPEVDDELIEKIGMKSVEELREKVRKECLEKKNKEQKDEIERKLVDLLIENHTFDIPEKLLMKQISDQEQNMRMEFTRLGLTGEKLEQEVAKLAEKNREGAERNIRANFIYDKIADKENILVTDQEVENELQVIARQQNLSLQEVKSYYEKRDLTAGLSSFMRNQKIREMLRESARIAEESPKDTTEKKDGDPEQSSESQSSG